MNLSIDEFNELAALAYGKSQAEAGCIGSEQVGDLLHEEFVKQGESFNEFMRDFVSRLIPMIEVHLELFAIFCMTHGQR